MDTIKITVLPASFALSESVYCSEEILFTSASTAVLSSSMINTRMKDTISKQAVAVQQEFKFIQPLIQSGRQFNHKMCFLHPANCSQMLYTSEAKVSFSHALKVA